MNTIANHREMTEKDILLRAEQILAEGGDIVEALPQTTGEAIHDDST